MNSLIAIALPEYKDSYGVPAKADSVAARGPSQAIFPSFCCVENASSRVYSYYQ